MNDLMEFLTSAEIMVVYLVAAVVGLICLIIYLFDRTYEKRRQRQNTRELNALVEEVNKEIEISAEEEILDVPVLEKIQEVKEEIIASDEKEELPVVEDVQPVVEPIVVEPVTVEEVQIDEVENLVLESMPDEELEYTDIEPTVSDAQAELQRLTETLEQAQEEANKAIDLTSFEEEQEQNAIISLDELMTRGRVMYENDMFSEYEDEGNEPISLADLEAQFNKEEVSVVEEIKEEIIASDNKEELTVVEEIQPIVQEQLTLDDFNTVKVPHITNNIEHRKFKSSPVISPVYGIEKTEVASVNNMELENTANYEKLDAEIKKTNEFLMTLRELQKNLD
ncbi:MAG: hypothetical protein E7160_04785 [Firmicutes bacterium]|nr:hypothetical protein [Bacillota bacterium]